MLATCSCRRIAALIGDGFSSAQPLIVTNQLRFLQIPNSEQCYTISLPLPAAPPPASAPRPLNYNISLPLPVAPPPAATPRTRRNGRQAHGKSPTIPPPYPWATNHRATVHRLKHLTDGGINTISGVVQCKRCGQTFEIEYDLKTKFYAISRFVTDNKYMLRDRAPVVWMNPALPKCKLCGEDNVLKPVMAVNKKEINWLFLLLGEMLGCCTLEQLKYFCKHTKNHRTGAKDRVLFLTYLTLCKQLDPNGSYERSC
ncbi:hypothetical protein LXL04_038294 [Taraxacum kok-saghyz]